MTKKVGERFPPTTFFIMASLSLSAQISRILDGDSFISAIPYPIRSVAGSLERARRLIVAHGYEYAADRIAPLVDNAVLNTVLFEPVNPMGLLVDTMYNGNPPSFLEFYREPQLMHVANWFRVEGGLLFRRILPTVASIRLTDMRDHGGTQGKLWALGTQQLLDEELTWDRPMFTAASAMWHQLWIDSEQSKWTAIAIDDWKVGFGEQTGQLQSLPTSFTGTLDAIETQIRNVFRSGKMDRAFTVEPATLKGVTNLLKLTTALQHCSATHDAANCVAMTIEQQLDFCEKESITRLIDMTFRIYDLSSTSIIDPLQFLERQHNEHATLEQVIAVLSWVLKGYSSVVDEQLQFSAELPKETQFELLAAVSHANQCKLYRAIHDKEPIDFDMAAFMNVPADMTFAPLRQFIARDVAYTDITRQMVVPLEILESYARVGLDASQLPIYRVIETTKAYASLNVTPDTILSQQVNGIDIPILPDNLLFKTNMVTVDPHIVELFEQIDNNWWLTFQTWIESTGIYISVKVDRLKDSPDRLSVALMDLMNETMALRQMYAAPILIGVGVSALAWGPVRVIRDAWWILRTTLKTCVWAVHQGIKIRNLLMVWLYAGLIPCCRKIPGATSLVHYCEQLLVAPRLRELSVQPVVVMREIDRKCWTDLRWNAFVSPRYIRHPDQHRFWESLQRTIERVGIDLENPFWYTSARSRNPLPLYLLLTS